jgi:hypothetical protein
MEALSGLFGCSSVWMSLWRILDRTQEYYIQMEVLTQGPIDSVKVPTSSKKFRSGHFFLFLFLIITENADELLVILGQQMSQ